MGQKTEMESLSGNVFFKELGEQVYIIAHLSY